MTDRKQYYFFAFFLVLQILLLQTTGCKKEYSCEGCLLTVEKDSTPMPSLVKQFPECSLCRVTDDLLLSKWNFKTGNAFVCGEVSDAGAGIDPEKKAFTFFGP